MQQQKPHTATKRERPSRWNYFCKWLGGHKALVAICGALGLGTVVISILAFAIFRQAQTQSVDVPLTHEVQKKPTAPKYHSALTGLELSDEATTKKTVTAVMIENSLDARPQSGLQDAEVVYEAIAEGGITRFAALYQQNQPELIGPVRSLRMYYLDWIAPYDPSIAHVGGSLYSLQEVRNGNHKDIDQFFNASTYWRASDRYAPHNVYTSSAKLNELNTSKGYTSANPQPLPHGDSPLGSAAPANQINVTMSSAPYNSNWNYDTGSKSYLRSQAGEPHMDREKGQLSAQVVVVLDMQMDLVMEDGWRENYHTAGTGDAMIFAGGTAMSAVWHKENMGQQLSFTSKQDGKPLPLPRGKTWISAVPVNEGGGSSWQ